MECMSCKIPLIAVFCFMLHISSAAQSMRAPVLLRLANKQIKTKALKIRLNFSYTIVDSLQSELFNGQNPDERLALAYARSGLKAAEGFFVYLWKENERYYEIWTGRYRERSTAIFSYTCMGCTLMQFRYYPHKKRKERVEIKVHRMYE